MKTPNVNTLWAEVIVDELQKAGLSSAVLSPGSRSTPLTVAFAEARDITTVSVLDERSAGFFALGRAKQTGTPVVLVCTSGTALANFHPAVMEASNARVPLLLLTADRPPELHDSGANQTIAQDHLYGTAVRQYRTLPEPEASDRKLRSLRVTLDRAISMTRGAHPGPVHLNVPFRKPLEPTIETEEVPSTFVDEAPLATTGRAGPFVTIHTGQPSPSAETLQSVIDRISSIQNGLIVVGPRATNNHSDRTLLEFIDATGYPVFADPLSDLRFGPHIEDLPIFGGYDSYVPVLESHPELVLRFGASPTSKPLRHYLRDIGVHQIVVDPAGGWPEAEFMAAELIESSPVQLTQQLVDRLPSRSSAYASTLGRIEQEYWDIVTADEPIEGGIVADAVGCAPAGSTIFVSNSMPVRDLDRFGQPRTTDVTVFGNRGVSGIDGIISTALGIGSACSGPMVCITGDLAYYHDMNGLLSIQRAGVPMTIVLVNNDGGGIFNILPISDHPTFDDWFITPHGLDFEPSADLYDLQFAVTDNRATFRELYDEAIHANGAHIIEVQVDGEQSHTDRAALEATVHDYIGSVQ